MGGAGGGVRSGNEVNAAFVFTILTTVIRKKYKNHATSFPSKGTHPFGVYHPGLCVPVNGQFSYFYWTTKIGPKEM